MALVSKLESPSAAGGVIDFDRGRPALACSDKYRGSDRGHDLLIGRLHRLDGIAGIDRALESVRRLDRDDVGDLRHVEQRGDAGQHILAHGRCRRQQRVVIRHQRHDQSRILLGKELRKLRRFRDQHFAHAVELGGLLGDGAATLSRDENIDLAADLARGTQRFPRRRREQLVVVIGEQKRGHLQHPRFVLELVDQRRHTVDFDPGLTRLGLG